MNWLLLLFIISPILIYASVNKLSAFLSNKLNYISLFTASLLLSVTAIHILPEVFSNAANNSLAGILIFGGLLFNISLEKFSNGLEHGHEHHHDNHHHHEKEVNHSLSSKKLWFFWSSYIALNIHGFLEGMPILLMEKNSTFLLGLIVHNIPVTLFIIQLLQKEKFKMVNQVLLVSFIPLASMLGALISKYCLSDSVHIPHEYILAFVSGIFFHFSTSLFFEFNKRQDFLIVKILIVIACIFISMFF